MKDDVAALQLIEPRPSWMMVLVGVLGLAATPAAWCAIQPFQVNVVRYEVQRAEGSPFVLTFVFSVLAFLAPLVLAGLAATSGSRGLRWTHFFSTTAPMVGTLPLGMFAFLSTPPPFFLILLAITGAGATAFLSGRRLEVASTTAELLSPLPHGRGTERNHSLALLTLIALIVLLTVIHFRIQLNFFNHFMYGHADIGHFTEELKNALAGRGLRSDSFDNSRLGWHFVPLLYVLVPGYALCPSPMYLMTLGPLVLHLGALPVYWFVRRRTGSITVAWLCGLAWLFLPSLSRLVYSNTYGFAWLYCSVPVLCFLLGAALLRHWKVCWILVAVLLLSRETNTAVTLGFGAYLAFFSQRRKAGIVIAAVSVGYALLSALVIIPYFASTGSYERLSLFGELGGSFGDLALSIFTKPELFFGRLLRAPSLELLLLLLSTMCLMPLRGWKLALAALPAVLIHFLMEDPDWLSIKFWHHAMVVPFLFFAALGTMAKTEPSPPNSNAGGTMSPKFRNDRNVGLALALLISAAWGHFFFGFSPLSKSYELYARDTFLQNPDPRLAFVDRLRREIPRDRTILATERIAAHFTDYKRLYTGRRIRPADFVIIDRSDGWDTSRLPDRWTEFQSDPHYNLYTEFNTIIVYECLQEAPQATED